MGAPAALEERLDFAARLRTCLIDAGCSPDSPTVLAHQFNQRCGGRTVTVHAARKWLLGESIPTQEKMRVLATWFEVSTDWLRFGGQSAPVVRLTQPRSDALETLSSADHVLLECFRQLDLPHQQSVLLLMQSLARANKQAQQAAHYRKSYGK